MSIVNSLRVFSIAMASMAPANYYAVSRPSGYKTSFEEALRQSKKNRLKRKGSCVSNGKKRK